MRRSLSTLQLGLAVLTLFLVTPARAGNLRPRPDRVGEAGPGGLPPVIRSEGSGPWSAPSTWEGERVPGPGARILVRAGHRVVYDVSSGQAIRAINGAG